jgi:hypothetical protein
VSFQELALSNMLTLNALVELLDERGILAKLDVLERVRQLRADDGRKTETSVSAFLSRHAHARARASERPNAAWKGPRSAWTPLLDLDLIQHLGGIGSRRHDLPRGDKWLS